MRVASLCLLDNCPADGFPLSSWRAGRAMSAKAPPLLALKWEALCVCHFRLLLGKVLEILCSQSQGFICVLLGTSSNWRFTPAGLQCSKGSITLKSERIQELKNLRIEDA